MGTLCRLNQQTRAFLLGHIAHLDFAFYYLRLEVMFVNEGEDLDLLDFLQLRILTHLPVNCTMCINLHLTLLFLL